MQMIKRFRSTSLLVLALSLTLGAGCGSGGIGGGGMSLDEEWQLGQQMAAQVSQQMRLLPDSDPAVAYVRRVGERIHAQTPQASLPYTFHIVVDPNVNAFSLPGGHIYVNSGLIAQADHANELAGVLGHEISHVVARHVVKQIQQQQGIEVLGALVLGQNPSALSTLVAQIVAGGAMARFSRADEKQADDLGLRFMTAAGYDPHGMLDMFRKLQSLEQGRPGAVERFFLDHPLTQDRINNISNQIGNARTNGIVDEPEYQSIRRRAS